jgi:DNA-directed RNA polymerase specialized sigma subunit
LLLSKKTIARTIMELRHLRYFLAVAKDLNFSEAARRLHVAHSAVSQTHSGFGRMNWG